MYYSPTQSDIGIIKQTEKEVFVKIDLLNRQFKILESLQGSLISDRLNVDSGSKQRRTYNCEMQINDASFFIGNDKKIWIDKYIRVYYGIKSARTKDIVWWMIGTFTYVDVSYHYNTSTSTISLSCADLMADFDGTKQGQLTGYSLTIPAGEDVRSTLIALLNQAGITKYLIESAQKEIPYDLEFSGSVTYCDIWTKICDLYDAWEFYFDVDGSFIWRKIPTGLSEPVIADDTLLKDVCLEETVNASFNGIYNVTEVWGKVLELTQNDRYADSSELSEDTYQITLENISSLEDINHLDRIGIRLCADSPYGAKISINGLEPIPIFHDDGTVVTDGRMKGDTTYVFSYRRNAGEEIQNCLYLLGQYQAYGIYKETNPDCPFSVGNLGYEIVNRVNYDHLYSDDLCFNQAQYLTYQTTAMMDTINLDLILIPWLDVNQKVIYTSHITNQPNQYLIKSFNWSTLDGTMSVTLYKFSESFAFAAK